MDFWAAVLIMATSIGMVVVGSPLPQLPLLLIAISAGAYGTWTVVRRRRDQRQRASIEQEQQENVRFGTPIEPKHATPKLKKLAGV